LIIAFATGDGLIPRPAISGRIYSPAGRDSTVNLKPPGNRQGGGYHLKTIALSLSTPYFCQLFVVRCPLWAAGRFGRVSWKGFAVFLLTDITHYGLRNTH